MSSIRIAGTRRMRGYRPLSQRLLVSIVPRCNHIQKCIELRGGDPFGASVNIQNEHPVLIEPSITRAGATLQPLMGSLYIKGCSGIHPPEGSRQIFACDQTEHGSCCPELPIDVARHLIPSSKQLLVCIWARC